MNFKTKLLVKLAFIFIGAIVLIAAGVLRNPLLTEMGAALLLCGAALAVKFFFVARDSSRMEELESSVNDERIAFIARKSYAFAFWISIAAEFCVACVLLFFNMNGSAVALDCIICFQAFIYASAYLFYSKKY